MRRRRIALAVVLPLLLIACTDDVVEHTPTTGAASSPAATPSQASSQSPRTAADLLGPAPAGDMALWASTLGLPVQAAVRTSTPLARLADTPEADRATICRQVAADLDTIAPPQVLTGVAITADSDTATLLVGDLQAKADLLAVCETGGPALDGLISEVERTHAIAVAWLSVLRGDA